MLKKCLTEKFPFSARRFYYPYYVVVDDSVIVYFPLGRSSYKKFNDREKVSDKNSEDCSGVGDDAGAFIVAGEPSGNYQPDAGNASVSMSDAGSTTGVTFDMAG